MQVGLLDIPEVNAIHITYKHLKLSKIFLIYLFDISGMVLEAERVYNIFMQRYPRQDNCKKHDKISL